MVSGCCTGHCAGGADDEDLAVDEWSTGQLAREDEDRALFARVS
jgi:hypothetical protein